MPRPECSALADRLFDGDGSLVETGMAPSPQILKALGERFGVSVIRERIFRQEYAKTLSTWRSNFRTAQPHLISPDFDDRFKRLWESHLACCEAGFFSGNIDVRQMVSAKPGRLLLRSLACMPCCAPLKSPAIGQANRQFPDMTINKDVVEAIGNTPLIKLKHASDATGCTILGKAEFMNPGQSVKDRAGKWMILEAEKRGDLKPGGLVVEATAGNTGIGLAVVANARGYRTLIVIPDTQSQEKEGHAALVRRRTGRGAGVAVHQSEQLPACRPKTGRQVAQERAERCVIRRSVEQSG